MLRVQEKRRAEHHVERDVEIFWEVYTVEQKKL